MIVATLFLLTIYLLFGEYSSQWITIGTPQSLSKDHEAFLVITATGSREKISGTNWLKAVYQWNTIADTNSRAIDSQPTAFVFHFTEEGISCFQAPMCYPRIVPAVDQVYLTSGTADNQSNYVLQGSKILPVKTQRSEIKGYRDIGYSDFLRSNGWEFNSFSPPTSELLRIVATLNQKAVEIASMRLHGERPKRWNKLVVELGEAELQFSIYQSGEWEILNEDCKLIANGNLFENDQKGRSEEGER